MNYEVAQQARKDKKKRKHRPTGLERGIIDSEKQYKNARDTPRVYETAMDYYADIYYTSGFCGIKKRYHSYRDNKIISSFTIPVSVLSTIRSENDFYSDRLVHLRENGLQKIQSMVDERVMLPDD